MEAEGRAVEGSNILLYIHVTKITQTGGVLRYESLLSPVLEHTVCKISGRNAAMLQKRGEFDINTLLHNENFS